MNDEMIKVVAIAIAKEHGIEDPMFEVNGGVSPVEVDGVTHLMRQHHGPLYKIFDNDARAALSAYEAHLKDNGLVVVPREPTWDMMKAYAVWVNTPRLPGEALNDIVKDMHFAMIRAAQEGGE